MKKRVAFKSSGNFYTNSKITNINDRIKEAINNDIQFLLVTGGGDGHRGCEMTNTSLKQYEKDTLGMLYTLKNAAKLYRDMKNSGIDNIVFASPFQNPLEPLKILERLNEDCSDIHEALKNGYIDTTPYGLNLALDNNKHIIVGGGSGYSNYSTDTAVALMAGNTGITTVLKTLTDYDYIYDKDPRKNPNAVPLKFISYEEAINLNIKCLDASSIPACKERDIDIRIASLSNSIADILNYQDEIGSTITNEKKAKTKMLIQKTTIR